MSGERQTEPHQAEDPITTATAEMFLRRAEDAESLLAASELERSRLEAELARVRAERDEAVARLDVPLRGNPWGFSKDQFAVVARWMARAEAAEACAETQVAEIVALIRSYANVHMTKALADLIEHKYIHGEESR